MAHAELSEIMAGEAAGAPSPPFAARVDRTCPWRTGRDPGGDAGGRRDRDPVRRRGGPLRVARAADLVGRTGVDPVPVAGDAGGRGSVPPRRAYADDGDRRQCAAGDARLSRSGRHRRGAGVSFDDRLAGLRICLRGKLYHDAGTADSQQLARGGIAGRHRPDGAVCAAAAGARRQCPHRAGARSLRSRW